MPSPARQPTGHTPAAHRHTGITAALVACAFVAVTLSCQTPATALGDSAPQARTNAHELLTTLAARFGPRTLDARLDSLRPKFARSALTPSRLFRDASLWTNASGDTRTLDIAGSGTPNDYALRVTTNAPPLTHLADYHRTMRLLHVNGDVYSWNVRDELAVGPITGDDLGRTLTLLFSATEHGDATTARTALARDLPRTSAALGRLFSIDSLTLAPNGQGGTDVHLTIAIHPGGIAHDFPHYARYAHKYLSPASYEMVLFDDAGREWWRTTKHDGLLSLAFRVHDGSLAPLAGPPSHMPDVLHLRIAGSTKSFIFRVGLKDLVGDVTLVHTPHARGVTIAFDHEPDWQLPPLVEQMLRSPLARPFAPPGATLSFALLDSAGAETRSTRQYSITVQESKIMRWFGGMGHGAISDFRKGAEQEFDRFDGEALAALDADVAALLIRANDASTGR